MMEEKSFTLKSRQDGLALSMLMVQPEGAPRLLVQLAHGMCEHKERYLPFMRYLAERGCLCAINDHRGHGASVRSREDLGYFYNNGDVALVEDLHQITLWMRERWPDTPLALLGHSMGSLAVRAYCEDYDRDIDALVVCGSPGYNWAALPGLGLIALMKLFRGERYRSGFLRKMTTGVFAQRFEAHPNAWISASEENVQDFSKDPLCGFTFTLNGNRALLRLMRRAYHLSSIRGKPELPVRFYSGAEDPCAPDEAGFLRAMEQMRAAGYRDVRGYMFEGMRHEILNERNRDTVFQRIWQEALEPQAKGDAPAVE